MHIRNLLTGLVVLLAATAAAPAEPLPGTKPLDTTDDLAARMVAGIDKYLMRELDASVGKRKERWKPDYTSYKSYLESVRPNRERLRKMLGVVDPRVPFTDLELVATLNQPPVVAETKAYKVYAVRWPVLPGVEGEGLLLEPNGRAAANVVAIPDADWTPEMLAGLAPGVKPESQFARVLAEHGCRVIVPTLIDRRDEFSGNPAVGRMTNQPHREFIYRMAYQMGRHIIGYEVQKVLAALDWLRREKDHPPVGVIGYGEGGLLATYTAALDEGVNVDAKGEPRDASLRAVQVMGYFGPRESVWEEPIYRNVFGLLREFGDAELFLLSAERRTVVIDQCRFPRVDGPPKERDNRRGAAPGKIVTPEDRLLRREADRVKEIKPPQARWGYDITQRGPADAVEPGNLLPFLSALGVQTDPIATEPKDLRKDFDPDERQKRQFDQLVAFTQKLMRDSEGNRARSFWASLDTSSPEKYEKSAAPFRNQLWEEVLGKLPEPAEPMNARSRQVFDQPKWKGYEVTLDVYPDVYAFGILCVPKDMKPGEKRPVVVCQHGLEGRPTDVVSPGKKTPHYNSFGSELADRGYVVFAPQNPYIGHDRFRVLQRKANPLGLSLFSFIIRQHERILDWLAEQPFVDPDRIGFYGLSYGGKTAMRVPAVLPRYCLSICSGDFNEWTWKNASVDFPGSYLFSPEYEMPEFNLAETMVYAEMAALIAPRLFMVERGHDDGVGIDEWVAYEYAKVRRHYSRLKIPERTEIEFFAGGHECHNTGTFAFLDRRLKWTPR